MTGITPGSRSYSGPTIPALDPAESPSVLGGIGDEAVWIGPGGASGTGASFLTLGYSGAAGAGGQAAWAQTDFVGSVAISAEDVHGNYVATWLEVDAAAEDDVLTLVDVGAGVLMPQWAPASGGGSFLPLAGGTMTGAILGSVGTAALPGYSFAGDPDTGIYRPAANVIGLSVAGVEVARVRAGGAGGLSVAGAGTSFGTVEAFRVNTPVTNINTVNAIFAAGAATHIPLHAQAAAAQTGFIFSVSNSAATGLAGFDSAGRLNIPAGSAANPGLGFLADPSTGLHSISAGVLGFICSGNIIARMQNSSGQFLVTGGSAALPTVSFVNDPDTGVYNPAANTLGLAAGGTLYASLTSAALTVAATQVLAASGGPSAPSFSFSADPDTGIYRQAADTLGLAAGGTMTASLTAARFTVHEDCVIGTAAKSIGFFGAGPVGQQTASGVVNGFTQNAGNEVRHDSTFTGDIGASAYTIGDLVASFKQLGLLAT